MTAPRLTPAIAALLAGPLDTFEKLEVAMALQHAPALTLSIVELVRATSLSAEIVERGIGELTRLRLAHSAGGLVRLTPPATDAPTFAQLRELYDHDRSAIARVSSDLALDKIRGMAMRTFSGGAGRRKPED